MNSNKTSNTPLNFVWSFLERIFAQGIGVVVSLFLARLLSPNDYGNVALVTIWISLSSVLLTSGLGISLIQKKDSTDLDFSTVFYISLGMGVLLFFILFFLSKPISDFYRKPELSLILKVLSLQLIFLSINSVQRAYVSRNLEFKSFFYTTSIGTVIGGTVGILCAFLGFGVWALVFYYLTNTIMDTILLFVFVKWKPKRLFSFERAKIHFKYSWKITFTDFSTMLFVQLRSLIIGKMYTPELLAYYNQGQTIPDYAISSAYASINSVLFPMISNKNNNYESVKKLMKKSIKLCSYIILPIIIGLFGVAHNFIFVLLSEKWIPCVPYLQIVCINYLAMPNDLVNSQAIKAIGRSDVYMKIDIIKKSISVIVLIFACRYGVLAIALSTLISSTISSLINVYPSKKYLNYGYFEQFVDVFPALWKSCIMVTVVMLFGVVFRGDIFITLIIQVILGIFTYILLSLLTKDECFLELLNYLRKVVVGLSVKQICKSEHDKKNEPSRAFENNLKKNQAEKRREEISTPRDFK